MKYDLLQTSNEGRKSVCRLHRVSEKNCANFFLSGLRQISTNFGNFWHKDYQNWWKFEEVLTKTILRSFLRQGVFMYSIN